MAPKKQAGYKKALNGFKSDVSLLRAFAKGDASAFESLYSRYKDQMFNHLCHQLGTHSAKFSAAEEIAQEVWMAVIRGADKFEDRSFTANSSFRAWLFSIAHRRIADFWRQHYKHEEDLQNTENHESTEQPTSNEQEPEESRLIQELQRSLNTLPFEQRQSFLLREEGFSYQEIADITEAGVETVKSRLRYAKNSLQGLLEDVR